MWPFPLLRSLMSCKDMRISAYPRYKSDVTTCECPEGYKWHLSERLKRMKSDKPALVKDRVLARVRRPFLAVSPNRPPKMPPKLMTVRMGVFPAIISEGCKVKHALGEGKPECRFKNKRMHEKNNKGTDPGPFTLDYPLSPKPMYGISKWRET